MIADGRWHRCATTDHPKKKNGAYLFDGERGVVKNWATMEDFAAYRDGSNVGHVDKAALRARRAIQQAETKAKHAEARPIAEEIVKRSVVTTHQYLVTKGFPEERGLIIDGPSLLSCFRRLYPENVTEQYLSRTLLADFGSGALVVPMREFKLYRQINSVQVIAENGAKLFLPRAKSEASVFFLGPFVARERWLVEGYATGLSVRAALRELHREAQVVVCFSSATLALIGKLAANLQPQSYVMSDNDKPNPQTGKKAGEEAAMATGLPWGMPAEVGTDANDLHQRQGVRALVKLIREINAVRQKENAA